MKVSVTLEDRNPGFETARKAGDAAAAERMSDPMLVAWYDGLAEVGHPDVRECTGQPGWLIYAESRGGDLVVDVNDGMFIMVYAETSPP